jgi:hypothetical protein
MKEQYKCSLIGDHTLKIVANRPNYKPYTKLYSLSDIHEIEEINNNIVKIYFSDNSYSTFEDDNIYNKILQALESKNKHKKIWQN